MRTGRQSGVPRFGGVALPLAGMTVGVTADRRADEQVQMLVQRGAKVVRGAVMRTTSVREDGPARSVTLDLLASPPDVLIANTALGMRTWWSLADGWGLTEPLTAALRETYLAARGPKAAGALLATGLDVDWRAASSTLDEVVTHLIDRGVRGRRVALQLDGGGAGEASGRLRSAGADLVEVQSYRWDLPVDRDPARRLVSATCERRVDAVTFTAAPAVHNFFALAEECGRADAVRDALDGPVLAVCVGPVCRDAALAEGVGLAKAPTTARLGSMVKTLTDELQARRRTLTVGDVELEWQGASVSVGAARVELTTRERVVFEALARRPGVVVGRHALGADDRALQATVMRLRRRLEPTGLGVEAVPRRGYRLVGPG